MFEGNFVRVQELPGRGVIGQLFQTRVLALAVSIIPRHRISQMLKMHTYLMRSSSVQHCLHERGRMQPLEYLIARPGLPPDIFGDSHSFAVTGVSRNGCTD